ncbi:glycosyl transferase [Spirochaetia bacterium]|nr:glycosyl transferase [Spirochaetia bacterium]
MIIYTIVVTYNGSRWVDKCFGSLVNSSIPLNIIAIDNGSTDNTPDIIRQKYPHVEVTETGNNLGFARANNIGIKQALEQGADYVFLLNQDAWVEQDTIKILVDTFKNISDAGILSPVHLNGDYTNLDSGFRSYISHDNTPDFISDLYFNRLKEYYSTNFINAAAWMISRKCIETVGGFDTSIFYHYGEDDNYCQRVLYHGFRIYIVPRTTMCHDRENRKDSVYIKENQTKISFIKEYANILTDDKILIKLFRKDLVRLFIKSIIHLRFKKLFHFGQDIQLCLKIKKSRELNKKGQMVWL